MSRGARHVLGARLASSARGTRVVLLGIVLGAACFLGDARAEEKWSVPAAEERNLVDQANAPISNILQIRALNTYLPEFTGARGQGNVLTTAVTMPLPAYRIVPRPQLSLLTMPTAVTTPAGSTGFGDLRFVDVAVLHAGARTVWGIGPTFVFPSASEAGTGQGKWQLGPAAAIAWVPGRWLIGALAQNPISFAGDPMRKATNALFLQPFLTYQLGSGWYVRSQPQMAFDWKTGRQVLPLDLGAGRVFEIGRQRMNAFVEPFWNASTNGPGPVYGITFGFALLYPDFWRPT